MNLPGVCPVPRWIKIDKKKERIACALSGMPQYKIGAPLLADRCGLSQLVCLLRHI